MNDGGPHTIVFRALMHPARRAILDALRGGEQCVCHLESALGMRQAYISQQLSVLKDAGIVRVRRDGWNVYYYVSRPGIYAVIDAARSMSDGRGENPVRRGVRPPRCSCPKCRSASEGMPEHEPQRGKPRNFSIPREREKESAAGRKASH